MVFWKIISVLTKFWESSPGKFDLFLWYFFLLENRIPADTRRQNNVVITSLRRFNVRTTSFWRRVSAGMCSCGKKALLKILMCSSTFCLSWKILCVLENLYKKSLLEIFVCRVKIHLWTFRTFGFIRGERVLKYKNILICKNTYCVKNTLRTLQLTNVFGSNLIYMRRLILLKRE